MEQFFENAKSVQRAIEFTQRFERSVFVITLYTTIEKTSYDFYIIFLAILLQIEAAMSGHNEQMEICSQSLYEGSSICPDRVHGAQGESSLGPQPSPSLREDCLVPSALP